MVKAAATLEGVVRALDPDVLCLQEVGLHPAERDQPDARRWTAARSVVRWPPPP